MISRHPWGGLADPSLGPVTDVTLIGLPYDASVAWRGGAREAPARLREISCTSPAISEEGFEVDPALLTVGDRGDIRPDPEREGGDEASRQRYFEAVTREFVRMIRAAEEKGRETFLLSLGGDHSLHIPLIRGFDSISSEPFGLIALDAHPDLFDTYDDSPLSAACSLRRALDSKHLSPEHLAILGTRSYNRVELDFMQEQRICFVSAAEIDHAGIERTLSRVGERLRDIPRVYLTLDIDVADPACAPGTGAPVAGGLSSRQLLDLTRGLLERFPVRAMDLVEVAPRLDPTEVTLFLALQIIFETFVVLARKKSS